MSFTNLVRAASRRSRRTFPKAKEGKEDVSPCLQPGSRDRIMTSGEIRAAVEHAVLRDNNGTNHKNSLPSPARAKAHKRSQSSSSSSSSSRDSDNVVRLKAALKAVAQHATVEGRRHAVLIEGGTNLMDALQIAAESENPSVLRLAALVFARLSAEADAAGGLAKSPALHVLDAVLMMDEDSASNPQDRVSISEGRRLAARAARNLAAFAEENAVAMARNSDVIRLLLCAVQDGISSKTSIETVESAAAIANLSRYGTKFQAYIRKHSGIAILASAAQHDDDAAVVFHAVRALAEFSLEQRWQVQLVSEGVVTVALAIIESTRDPEIVSEATRCIGNVAASRTGREAIMHTGGVEYVTRRVVMMSVPAAGATRDFAVKGRELRLAADLFRAMSNLCVGSKEASQRVANCGGVTALITACDQEDRSKDSERVQAIENIKAEAFRGLLIIAQAGPSFRATVLREIGVRTRSSVAIGRCVAHLYDLARRIKVEASTERKDDIPQTIAGLGAASKDYIFQVGPLAQPYSTFASSEVAHSVPDIRSPCAHDFRQSARVLSVQRPQHHRARLAKERQQRLKHDSTVCDSSCAEDLTEEKSFGHRRANSENPDPRNCQECCDRPNSTESIPHCNVLESRDKVHAARKKIRTKTSDSNTDSGTSPDADETNWAMAVWSFVSKPLSAPCSPSSDIQELDEDVFEIGTPLGRGGFATVYLAKNLRNSELVAVKRFHPVASALPDAKRKAEMAARRAMKEQRIWDGLSHRNIVEYRGCFFGEEGELNLVAEYVAGWSLADHLAQIQKFPEHLVARITKQIVDGIDYLHRQGVTHRDVKPANILVDPDGVVKITDFGVSSALDVPTMTGNTLVGTPWYIAPEMIEGRPYGKSVDIWSLGCTVLELATGKRPYHELRAHEALFRIAQDRKPPPVPQGVSKMLRDFLLTCWVWDPEKRPLTANLKRHPFLSFKP